MNATDSNFGGSNFGSMRLENTSKSSPCIHVISSTPSTLAKATKSKPSRLGFGDGRQLLDYTVRRKKSRSKRIYHQQHLVINSMKSAISQASMSSLLINPSDLYDNKTVCSVLSGSLRGGGNLPHPNNYGQSGGLYQDAGYDSADDTYGFSKYSDESTINQKHRNVVYRSRIRGTRALLRLTHIRKSHKIADPEHPLQIQSLSPSSRLNKSSSYLSFRFVMLFCSQILKEQTLLYPK